MFSATQIDKIRRNVKKYQDGEVSNLKLVESMRKPLYFCAIILSVILVFCIYLEFTMTSKPIQSSKIEKINYSDNVTKLYDKFIDQFNLARSNPKQTMNDKISMPENVAFTRSKTIQYLFDYIRAAMKEIYVDEYRSDPNYHHIKCMSPFTPPLYQNLAEMENAVKNYIKNGDVIYQQKIISNYTLKTKMTSKNNGGIKSLIGQYGVIATKYINKYTAIGQYYGDEYLMEEYETRFTWNIYEKKKDHPFHKKWAYYMTIPFHSDADQRLNIPLNVTLAIDAYHWYNHSKYIQDGDDNLSEQIIKMKENIEPFINDGRAKISKRLTPFDIIRKNCEYVYCSVDGVLMTFLVIIKDIKPNQQLFVYYGPDYT